YDVFLVNTRDSRTELICSFNKADIARDLNIRGRSLFVVDTPTLSPDRKQLLVLIRVGTSKMALLSYTKSGKSELFDTPRLVCWCGQILNDQPSVPFDPISTPVIIPEGKMVLATDSHILQLTPRAVETDTRGVDWSQATVVPLEGVRREAA